MQNNKIYSKFAPFFTIIQKMLKEMKKVFAIFAIVAIFAACNKPAKTETIQQDSVVVEEVLPDTLVTDSVVVVDSAVVM